jgi:hypothetical protein
MFSMRKVKMALVMAALAAAASQSFAGTGQGKVGSMVVGRLGYQVFVQITDATFAQFACGTPNANNWTFAFSTQNPGGKDMLATVLAAKTSGATLIFVGNGQCTQDPAMEDVSYVIAL